MVMRTGKCATCVFWRRGASPNMEHPAPDRSDHELGVCEVMSPTEYSLPNGHFMSRQPVTHSSRSCAMWEPDGEDDDDGDDEGPPTDPQRTKIRNLFPVQPAPVAA